MTTSQFRSMATEAIHAGEIHDPSGAHIAPIYQSSSFTFDGMHAVEAWGEGTG
jgi:O-acetylhomoserine/O-acetylserine sulfhydrylase-like pyridoxal-dependent enzyme